MHYKLTYYYRRTNQKHTCEDWEEVKARLTIRKRKAKGEHLVEVVKVLDDGQTQRVGFFDNSDIEKRYMTYPETPAQYDEVAKKSNFPQKQLPKK